MSDFEQLVDRAVRHAKKTLHRQGELYPTWFVVAPNGDEAVEKTPWENPLQKLVAIASLRFFLEAIRAQRFVMVCESWMVHAQSDADAEEIMASGISLEMRADRVEVISIVGEDQNGEHLYGFIPMHRQGRTFRYDDLVRDSGVIKSNFAGMIRPAGPLQ